MPTSEASRPKQWDVVVLPFPYADRLAEKRRPALVVSAGKLAARHDVLWVAMITSLENPSWDGDVAISDLRRAGLSSPSVVRPAKITTIDVSRILRVAGTVPDSVAASVHRQLIRILGAA